MKVKQLIKELQKMPQNLDVFYAHHDNCAHETAGDCFSVMLFEKKDYSVDDIRLREDKERFEDMPTKCVVIRG